MDQQKISKWAVTSGVLGILAALIMLFSGYGYQWNWWELGTAFRYLLPGSALLGILALSVAVVFAFVNKPDRPRRLKWMALVGAFLGISVLANAGYWFYQARQYPPIHDITTDTENPPAFDAAIVTLRRGSPNISTYGGQEIADIQREHYPDIQPLFLDVPYSQAFERALQAAEAMPWEKIVTADKESGLIQATDKLPWFGFKDDIVIRLQSSVNSDQVKIDVRSVSRIGQGDIGVNAQRIRDYLEEVESQ